MAIFKGENVVYFGERKWRYCFYEMLGDLFEIGESAPRRA